MSDTTLFRPERLTDNPDGGGLAPWHTLGDALADGHPDRHAHPHANANPDAHADRDGHEHRHLHRHADRHRHPNA